MKIWLISALLLSLTACSRDNDPQVQSDLGVDLLRPDLTGTLDSSPGADVIAITHDFMLLDAEPVDAGFGACSGECATQTLQVVFGDKEVPLEVAFYGMDRDELGNPGLYLEAYHGASDGCPTETSLSPDQTLFLSGLPLPTQGGSITHEDGLVVSLVDFQGDLLSGLVTKALSAEITFKAALTCPSCVGGTSPSHPEGFVALELTATFAEGTISGHLYARHCDSLDL
ncbi:MAG: hypothetical protein JRH20_06505 [Deltaproteobacteria bacterium]|nr:hypothetical protein [Deltaproteobacteria bacterium]